MAPNARLVAPNAKTLWNLLTLDHGQEVPLHPRPLELFGLCFFP